MKTAEEILKEHTGHAHVLMGFTQIKAMKAYAKQVAKQALKDAGENVKLGDTISNISKQILQTEIKLP